MFHLSINSKCRVPAAGFQDDLFKMIDPGVIWPGCKIVLEFFYRLHRPFCHYLDAAVVEISDIASDLMTSCRTLGKIAKTDALNFPADHKFPCNGHGKQFRVSDFKFQVPNDKLIGQIPGIVRLRAHSTESVETFIERPLTASVNR